MSQRVRAFIAVDVSHEAKAALASIISRLKSGTDGDRIRWVKSEGIHLTLKFLGNVESALVHHVLAAVERAVNGTPPFQVALSKVGAFPRLEAPRVIWVGLQGNLETLAALQRRMEDEVSPLGFPKEERPFNPHLTLGRVNDGRIPKSGSGLDLAKTTSRDEVAWWVEEVHLMQSTPTPSGSIYTRLGSIPLGEVKSKRGYV